MNLRNNQILEKILSNGVSIIFSIFFLAICIVLNLQYLEGSNINYSITGHDEYLTVREVYSIINPLSIKHFIMAIISGDVFYYGRVMFYTDALFAYIPFKIWGLAGMVFSIRMIHSLWILISLLLLNRLFIQKRHNQFLFLFGVFGVMYSLYFIQMPKPEPMQLLFLTLFLKGLIKNNYYPKKYFIWLGLALAIKINVLVILPISFIIPIYFNRHVGLLKLIKVKMNMLYWFFIGFFIGIPCLLLSPIQPIYLKSYLHETIFGTKKSYDDPNLGIFQWIDSGLGGYYTGSKFLAYIFLAISVVILFFSFIRYVKSTKKEYLNSLIIISVGLILMLSVMLFTKRLWPHYLWTGFILIWLGLIFVSEFKIQPLINKIFTGLLAIIFTASSFAFYTNFLPVFLNREKTLESTSLINDSRKLYQYLESKHEYSKVGIDGSVFYPFRHFVQADPYHPFATKRPIIALQLYSWYKDQPKKIWDNCDAVVFYKYHPSLERSIKKNGQYLYPNEEELYKLFLDKTKIEFKKDTTIGVYQIYKRIKT